MPAYCFFDVLEVTDPDELAKDREGVLATVERYGDVISPPVADVMP
jgi:hypothetical protein